MACWNTIGCAVDESSGSYAAMREAARLARDLGAALILAHVEAPSTGEAPFAPPPPARIFRQHFEVRRWIAAASDIRGEEVRLERLCGDPADEILRFARSTGCDVLVVGARARNRIALALGSVAAKVLVDAPCPVLVVTPEAQERDQLKSDFPGQMA